MLTIKCMGKNIDHKCFKITLDDVVSGNKTSYMCDKEHIKHIIRELFNIFSPSEILGMLIK